MFKEPFSPWTRYANHPNVDRRGLPRIKREWLGEKVCIHYMKRRGHYRQRTLMGYAWGVLSESERDEHVTITESDGTVRPIHYSRIQTVWNLSRKNQP